jgi:hypothetical protein
MDAEAATIHAFRRLLLHPNIATAAVVSSAVQSSKEESGRTGRGLMFLPLKGESWVTLWGTILGKRGGGFGSAMVVLMIFFSAANIGSDLKKVNASWSL